ncbi:hypothetical protein HK107_00070 [Parvularcula sp. ZS-1/3]|uniref:Uncharacterized protein n=1 Tax=Parvularcula mediterranea TaxID=2732508 RepID=A0A7Y3RJB5_9PROT|nr:hypothetical protein [Parvularcula mediterranea]NNU14715.1 hypothetical protein [Parvularcula mediterranea]
MMRTETSHSKSRTAPRLTGMPTATRPVAKPKPPVRKIKGQEFGSFLGACP